MDRLFQQLLILSAGIFSQLLYAQEHPNIYKINDSVVLPSCFEIPWSSTDNYEILAEHYKIADIADLIAYPGKYYGNPVTLAPVKFFVNKITLHQTFPHCNTASRGRSPSGGYVVKNGGLSILNWFGTGYKTYALQEKLPLSQCTKLAPHLDLECIDVIRVDVAENTSGTYTTAYEAIYGVFVVADSYAIIPLRNLKLKGFDVSPGHQR